MNQVDHNINKDMSDLDLIDVESLDFSDEQTWLHKVPQDSGRKVDIVDWSLSLDWPVYDDEEYEKTEKNLYVMLDEILKNQVLAMPDKHKFDSRTYVKPKKRVQRPSINNIMEVNSNPPSISPHTSLNMSSNKYLTYNKYSSPLGPMLRLKTFNVETNTDNSNVVKEFAIKRRSLVQDEDPQLEDIETTLVSDVSDRLSSENLPSKPINIDLSQPAHNLHNTFNKGMILCDRSSLNMYQSGESLMRMSPPSLVSSLLMENSGTFNLESLEGKKSLVAQKDSGVMSGRESIDPMMTSMTLSILDEKDMSTSFLSQTTYPDNDSLMDSLPPSLVSSVNSSYIVHTPKPRTDSIDSANNIFSSATFTHLEQSEKLLSARPRHQLFNSMSKRDTAMRTSESYTKTREEACQIDSTKILNENTDKKDSVKTSKASPDMTETITLHYSNNKFRRNNDAEKENLNASFEKDDTFYKDMGMQRTVDLGKNSLNITLDKQELNEIIQARQKLSMARKALPNEPERLPNQVETSPVKSFHSPNQTMSLPKKSMENASELLSRRRVGYANGFEKEEPVREPPKRNATFKKTSPRAGSLDTTVVYVKDDNKIIDINSATLNLIDGTERTLQQEEWGSQERAMVGSSESTDTATFSSSSPPESVPDTAAPNEPGSQIASTPLTVRKTGKLDLLNLHTTISPIYNMVDDTSYTVTKAPTCNSTGVIDVHNTTVINSATMVKKGTKRDILSGKVSPDKKMMGVPNPVRSPVKVPTSASYSVMPPPVVNMPRKTSLPTSKLRQYSSHRELRIPVSSNGALPQPQRSLVGRAMVRRNVYASNPALSPTAPNPHPYPYPHPHTNTAPARRDSYTIAVEPVQNEEAPAKPVLTNPPVLVRQGTETLRRERPQSQLVQPKDLRAAGPISSVPASMRQHLPPPTTRPYSIAGASQLRVNRPTSVPAQKAPVAPPPEQRPASSSDARLSALPRPSRLPAPRRTLRPPSVYSVAPTADMDHY